MLVSPPSFRPIVSYPLHPEVDEGRYEALQSACRWVKWLVVHPVPDGVKQGAQGAVEPAVPVVLPSPLFTKESTLDKINGWVIDSVIRLLSQFAEHINNQSLNFVAVKERHKNGTDKCNHCSKKLGFSGPNRISRVGRVCGKIAQCLTVRKLFSSCVRTIWKNPPVGFS